MASKDFSVRIGQDEIAHILNRKENLDHHGQLWGYVSRYRALGWDLAIVTTQGADLDLDLEQPEELWWKQLADLGLDGAQLNLAIRTGRPSRLLVLEVNKGSGAPSPDLLGDWRAQCVAELGNCREQHYYFLPPESQEPPSFFLAQEVLIYGAEGLILAPPSLEPEAGETWRWLMPPWESPLQAPKPAVWQFLREHLAPSIGWTPEVTAWDEIYPVIAIHEPVLKALLVPPTSLDIYYRDLLQAAMAVGLRDHRFLLGLMWHASHGDARSNGNRWIDLQNLLAGENLEAAGSPPGTDRGAGDGSSPGRSWPDRAPGLEPSAPPLVALESPNPTLTVGELTRQLLSDLECEPSQRRFDKSVSGQFFQLLAALGERVIVEACRQEGVQYEKGEQATGLERLVTEIEHYLISFSGGADNPKTATSPAGDSASGDPPWVAGIIPTRRKTRKLQEVKAMVRDFLNKNPELAEDESEVQMVLFCLKNYVSINPEFASLSFRDKLEKAGQMARSFLDQQAVAQ